MDGLGVEAVGLRDLSRDLRRLTDGGVMRKRLRLGLKAAAEPIAADMRSRTSWSTKIPGSIRVGVTQKGVYIRAGGPKAPNAAPFEGGPNNQATFRHPVFGHRDRWVTQDTRPFALPALQSGQAEMVERVGDEIEQAFRDVGFH